MRASVTGLAGVLSNRPARVFCLNACTCFVVAISVDGSSCESIQVLSQESEDIFSSSKMLSTTYDVIGNPDVSSALLTAAAVLVELTAPIEGCVFEDDSQTKSGKGKN